MLAGKRVRALTRRMTIETRDRVELRTLAVHAGTAFILHCATTVGSWRAVERACKARGESLHILPPNG